MAHGVVNDEDSPVAVANDKERKEEAGEGRADDIPGLSPVVAQLIVSPVVVSAKKHHCTSLQNINFLAHCASRGDVWQKASLY